MLSRPTEGESLDRGSALAARLGLGMAVVLCATGCLHRQQIATPPVANIPAPAAPTPTAPVPRVPATPPAPIVQGEEGIASWYGPPFNGRRAANGEIFDMYAMTAAHRTLPFGTIVRVHNLDNDRDVDVRINDRGPFVEGRIIDLSYAAAQAMGMTGLAHVRLEILGFGESAVPGLYAVQVGAFRDPANAGRLKALIEANFRPVAILTFDSGNGVFYRVRVGQETSESAAFELAQKLRNANLATETFVVRMN